MPTKHYPYMFCPRTGKGPKGRSTERADEWSCTCAKKKHRPNYRGSWSLCNCMSTSGKRRTKKVWNNLDRRNGPRGYGALYRKWVKENHRRICPRPGRPASKKWFPRQGSGIARPLSVKPTIRLRIKTLIRRHGHAV